MPAPSYAWNTTIFPGKSAATLANVLDIHKIVNTEEKRRGIEGLGRTFCEHFDNYGQIAWAHEGDEDRRGRGPAGIGRRVVITHHHWTEAFNNLNLDVIFNLKRPSGVASCYMTLKKVV
jgi:hypothetical protein